MKEKDAIMRRMEVEKNGNVQAIQQQVGFAIIFSPPVIYSTYKQTDRQISRIRANYRHYRIPCNCPATPLNDYSPPILSVCIFVGSLVCRRLTHLKSYVNKTFQFLVHLTEQTKGKINMTLKSSLESHPKMYLFRQSVFLVP